MKSAENWKISFTDLSLKNTQILAQQSEISYAQALAQVQRLSKTSKVSQSTKKQEGFVKELATQDGRRVKELPKPESFLAKGGEARGGLYAGEGK